MDEFSVFDSVNELEKKTKRKLFFCEVRKMIKCFNIYYSGCPNSNCHVIRELRLLDGFIILF